MIPTESSNSQDRIDLGTRLDSLRIGQRGNRPVDAAGAPVDYSGKPVACRTSRDQFRCPVSPLRRRRAENSRPTGKPVPTLSVMLSG